MPGSTVQILYNSVDITNKVLYKTATFTTYSNGQPGTFELTVKDPTSSLNLTTGKGLYLYLDGAPVFGGYVTSISRTFAFPNTTINSREWVLRGVDFNILFDKRVLRRTANYTKPDLPYPPVTIMDGDAIKFAMNNYVDWGIDLSGIDNVLYYNGDGVTKAAYPSQGSKIRELFDITAQRAGAVYYISAEPKVYYRALETMASSWGFSDAPNGTTTFKMREAQVVEDGSQLVNDMLIWGGSEWSGNGGTVFSRVQDTASQSVYGRWQAGEVHFGEEGYGIQSQVDAAAQAIVNGPTNADATNINKARKFPQWQIGFSWWLHDVPSVPVPGQLFTIAITAFGVTRVLPLRSLTMTFPGVTTPSKAYVLMRGEFSLSVDDPYTLWNFVRSNSKRLITTVVGAADDDSETTVFGAYGMFTSSKITNVSGLTYKLPFGYIPSTLQVYVNGLALTPRIGFTETNNVSGTFTFASAPIGTFYVTCRTLHA